VKAKLECLICGLKQGLRTARQAGASEDVQHRLLVELMGTLAGADLSLTPAQVSQGVYEAVNRLTGVEDPYAEAKARHNQAALGLLDRLHEAVRRSADPLSTALRLAAAGNIIDLGVLEDRHVDEHLESVLRVELARDDSALLLERLRKPCSILYLLDNAGEIVFDRVLMEQLRGHDVCAVVKSGPIINDVTRKDAETVGVDQVARVVELGCNSIGVNLERASEEFHRCFRQADVVISKGQGNFETLDETPAEIFFILRVKCDIIARHLGVDVHDSVLIRSPALER